MIKIYLTLKHHFRMGEKLLELFFIENDFAKHFGRCHNSISYFVLHVTVIHQNDTFSVLQEKS